MSSISVDYDVLNQKGSPAWYSDTFANIPTPGYKGRMFISTDTFAFYRDNGTGWDLVGGPGTGTITGAGVSGQVTYFIGTDTIGGNNNLFYDITNSRLGIGTATPGAPLDIHTTGTAAQFNGTGVNNSFVLFQNAGSSKWRIGNLYNSGANDYQIFDVINSTARLTIKNTGASTLIGTFTATSLIKSGGTSSQILLADGSTTPTSTFGAGSVTNVSALTLGTTGTDLTSSVVNSTTTPVITLNVPTASATNRGALSSADWTTFNNKQATLSLTTTGTSGAATLVGATLNIPNYTNVGTVTSVAALTLGTTGTDLSSSVANSTSTPVITLNVPTASATNRGALSSADWTTFNNKQGTISVTAPVVLTGATISMPAATTSVSGYLTSTDWNTFNNKTSNLGTVTDVVALTIGTSGIDITSTAVTTTTTPVITLNIPTASASNRGALSSTDWTTFNNKQATLSLTTTGTSGAATLVANTLNVPNYTLSGLGGIGGSGNANYLPKFTASTTIGNSIIQDAVNYIDVGGYAFFRRGGKYLILNPNYNAANVYADITSEDGMALSISANGQTQQLYINTSGNVGIGTALPGQLLHLETTLGASSGVGTAIQITSGGAGGDQAWVGVNKGTGNGLEFSVENRDIIFNTGATTPFGGTERMRLTSSGNLGLGITPSAWTTGYVALQLPSNVYGGGSFITDNGSPAIVGNAYNNGSWKYVNTDFATIYQSRSGQHQWYNAPSGTGGGTISFTQAMTLTNSGNLGIGIASPGAKLQVKTTTSAGGTDAFYIENSSAALFEVRDDGLTYMKGNLGIGVMPTTTTFQVQGSVNNNLAFFNNTASSGYATARFFNDTNREGVFGVGGSTSGSPYANNCYIYTGASTDLVFVVATTEKFRIASSGAATFTSTLGINGTSNNVRSGTYTPTVTAGTNCSAVTAYPCQYMQVDKVVTVSGYVYGSATAITTETQFTMSTPVNTNFTQVYQCGGTGRSAQGGTAPSGAGYVASISANATNEVRFSYTAPAVLGTGGYFWFSFTYQII